jgi:hypothetical protein
MYYLLGKEYILKTLVIHGPGNKGNLNLLYELVAKGLSLAIRDFQNERSFEYRKSCFVIRELLNNATIPSGVYQVADDESLSTNKLIALLSGSLNKKTGFLKILNHYMPN